MKHIIYLVLIFLPFDLLAQEKIIDFTVKNPNQIHFYYKNEKGEKFRTIQNLKEYLKSKQQKLLFATNGGMFTPEYTPVGLYIQDFKTLKGVNKVKGGGNFGLKPNGIFYLTSKNEAKICITEDFRDSGKVYFKQKGCRNALYLDGAISEMYCPEKGLNQTFRSFGVIIGVTEK